MQQSTSKASRDENQVLEDAESRIKKEAEHIKLIFNEFKKRIMDGSAQSYEVNDFERGNTNLLHLDCLDFDVYPFYQAILKYNFNKGLYPMFEHLTEKFNTINNSTYKEIDYSKLPFFIECIKRYKKSLSSKIQKWLSKFPINLKNYLSQKENIQLSTE